jgi:hypothetical protein
LPRRVSRKGRTASVWGSLAGLAVGLALLPFISIKPRIDQIPGIAAATGLNPTTDVLRLAALALLPLVGGALGLLSCARGARRFRPRPRMSTSQARLETVGTKHVFLAAIVAHALIAWALTAEAIARGGIAPPLLLCLLLTASFLTAVVLGGGKPRAGAVFLAAASPILVLALRPQRLPWIWVMIAWLGLPVVARLAAAHWRSLTSRLQVVAIVVLLPGSVVALGAALDGRLPTVADLFENGHSLLPASEYLRGELPYRDIVPGHGLAIDGLLQEASLKSVDDSYIGFRRGEVIAGLLFWPSLYFLAYAATGSPSIALTGILYTFVFFPEYSFTRATLSVAMLGLAILGARSKSKSAWLLVGLCLPLSVFVAVDFALYGFCGIATALWIARGNRILHLRRVCLGAVLTGLPLMIYLAARGLLGVFLSTTFVYIPSLLPAYAQGLPPIRMIVSSATPDLFRAHLAVLYISVLAFAVLLGAFLPRAPIVGQRVRAILPVCAWVTCAMMAVVERRHLQFPLLLVPIGIVLVGRLALLNVRFAHTMAVGGTVVAASWFSAHALVTSLGARLAGPVRVPEDLAPFGALRRASGALFRSDAAHLMSATMSVMSELAFEPDDTWVDFSNAPGLYFVLDRGCPVRYYEVPFYESEAAQYEVIDSIRRNPHVKVALMASGLSSQDIDGISNSVRAPLVDAFIREKFEPFRTIGAAVFWRRKDEITEMLRVSPDHAHRSGDPVGTVFSQTHSAFAGGIWSLQLTPAPSGIETSELHHGHAWR